MTLVLAMVAALSGAVFVSAPSAVAAGLSNPSGTLTVECPGARAFIQVDWKGANKVTIRWSIEDTGTASNMSPVLRIQARDADGSVAPFVFPGDNAWYIHSGGNGTRRTGLKSDWNPGNMADLNHLVVRAQNGTTSQGTSCVAERKIYNWSRIAYRRAVDQEGKGYRLGYEGPTYFDCSGLVLASYNAVPHFPDFPIPGSVRTAESIYHWMQDHRSPAKRYAKSVSPGDLKVGDLLFFDRTAPNGRDATHVAFWAGNNTLFHAFSPSTPIGFTPYSSYFSSRFVAAYRMLGVATVANP